MRLRIREFKYEVCLNKKSRTSYMTKEEYFPIQLGYIEFKGIREKFPYDKFISINEIRENEVIVSVYNESEVLKETFTLTYGEEKICFHKGPKGLPYGYNYHLLLEERDYEK